MEKAIKKIKAFWYVYKKSLFDVDYYKDLLKVRRDFSFKYFFTLAIVAAIIATTSFAIPNIPKIKKGVGEIFDQFAQIYPNDLIITSKGGEWSINQPEPYAIQTPEFFKSDDFEETDFPENLIVFDHEGTIDDLDKQNTFVVVNEVNVITKDSQNKIEAYPLEGIPDGALDKKMVLEGIQDMKQVTRFLPLVIVTFVLIGTLFYFAIFRLGYLFIVALLLMAFGYLRGVRTPFRTYYKLGLHTLTLPLTLEVLLILLRPEIGYASWFFGLNIIFGIVVVNHLNNIGAFKK